MALVMLTGCGNLDCKKEFFTDSIYICSEIEDIPDNLPKLTDKTIEIVESETQKYYPKVTNLKETLKNNNVTVTIIDEVLVEDCELVGLAGKYYRCKNVIGGFNSWGNNILISYSACPDMTILSHEILHSVESYYFDDARIDHKRDYFFNKPHPIGSEARKSTIETRANKRIKEFCKEISE